MAFPKLSALNAIVDPKGKATQYFMGWINDLIDVVMVSKVKSDAAVDVTRNVIASGGLHGGGNLTDEIGVWLYRAKSAVAGLPSLGMSEGDWAYALDGRKPGEGAGAGTGLPVYRSGGAWMSIHSGSAVTA